MYILDDLSLPSTRFCSVVFLEIRRKAKLCYRALNTGNKFFAGNLMGCFYGNGTSKLQFFLSLSNKHSDQ